MFSGSGHRYCVIQKVENGYKLKVMVVRKVKARDPAPAAWQEEREGERAGEEQYVFYTVEEVLDFIKNYLNSGKADLKRKKE
jgi:hypothetical protein